MKSLSIRAFIAVFSLVLTLGACSGSDGSRHQLSESENSTDSMLMEMLESAPSHIEAAVDSLQEIGLLTETKGNYYRAQAHYRLGQDLTAELCYKRALATDELYNDRPATFYFACDQLSTILTCKGDEQGSLDIATKGYGKARYDKSPSGQQWAALLLHDIGYCQMRLDQEAQAERNFKQAYSALKELAASDSSYDYLYSWARVSYNILDAYTSTGHFDKAALWMDSVEVAVKSMASSAECSPQKAEEYIGSFYTHKASVLTMTGHRAEADKVYEKFLHLDYANTNLGLVDNAEYLEMAERWNDRANLTPRLDSLLEAWEMPFSMYYLNAYQFPNFKAFLKSGRREEALQRAQLIAEKMDSIENYERNHNAAELSIMYETQEKEMQIAEQQAQLRYQRMIALAIAALLLTIFLTIFMYFRHRASVKLAEKNRELEQKNRELTIANARAEESSRMKTNFIQQISHEIRTPLNILSGFAQIVTTPGMELDDATRKDINQKITENTDRITGLVNKMLELSDASSKIVIERTDRVLAIQVAAQAVEGADIQGATHIKFDLQITPEAENAMLLTNERQSSHALVLLLDNARKFTKQGSVTLKVSTQAESVVFTVEDTGIGVPADEAEHIFDEFVQLDDYYDGTGIGLTVARSIVRRLGGDVVLDTSYHDGARFVMTLPRA